MGDVQGSIGLDVGAARYRAAQGDTYSETQMTLSGSVGGRSDVQPAGPNIVRWPTGYFDSGLHWSHAEAGRVYLEQCRTGRL